MTPLFLKAGSAVTILLSSLALSNAMANEYNYLLSGSKQGTFTFETAQDAEPHKQRAEQVLKPINENYLGNAASIKLERSPHRAKELKALMIELPVKKKSGNIYQIQKSKDNTKNGKHEDLIFDSKENALNFCASLSKLALVVRGVDGESSIYLHKAIPADNGLPGYPTASRVLAVPYGSSPDKEYVLCENPFGSVHNVALNGEEESAGVLSGSLENGFFYKVTCTDPQKPATTFSSRSGGGHNSETEVTNGIETYKVHTQNLKTLHNYNEFVGAQYCSAN